MFPARCCLFVPGWGRLTSILIATRNLWQARDFKLSSRWARNWAKYVMSTFGRAHEFSGAFAPQYLRSLK